MSLEHALDKGFPVQSWVKLRAAGLRSEGILQFAGPVIGLINAETNIEASAIANRFIHSDGVNVTWKAFSLADIPIGADGQVLTSESGTIVWQDPASELNPVAEFNRAALPYAMPVAGDLIFDNTLIADADLVLNPATGEVTVAQAGLYEVEAYMAGAITDTTTAFQLELQADAITFGQAKAQFTSSGGSEAGVRVREFHQFTAGQVLKVVSTRYAGPGTGQVADAYSLKLFVRRLKN